MKIQCRTLGCQGEVKEILIWIGRPYNFCPKCLNSAMRRQYYKAARDRPLARGNGQFHSRVLPVTDPEALAELVREKLR